MKKSNDYIYNRIRTLAGTGDKNINESITRSLINYEKAIDGSVYGIVKENHHYYIKRSSKKENLNESDFAFIGGLENKNQYRYDSLSEAEKQRNFFIKTLNESISLEPIKKTKIITEEVTEKTIVDDPFNFLKNRINEGKRENSVKMQNKFKNSLTPNNQKEKKAGLLPEAADFAIKKALGLINEEVLSTADSQINASDVMANKTDAKETPQAPVNDSNAKSLADKGVGQPNPLITVDGEIDLNDAMANKTDAKETPQAPVNDSNAKSLADKNNVGSGSFETAKKESGSIVTENADITTADSEIKDADMIANKKGHEAPEAPYNNYNQPEKGEKENKGTELKTTPTKKDVVAESDLITSDSEITDGDIMSNKKDKKETPQAPVNDSNAKSLADKNNTGKGSFETAKKETKAIVNEAETEDDDTEKRLDAAADALNDLNIDIESEPEQPEMGGEEMPAPDGEMPAQPDNEMDMPKEPEMGDEEMPAPDGEMGGEENMTKEIEKLVGKLTQKIRNTEITPETTQSIMNSVITALKNELGDVDVEERKEMTSKIMNVDDTDDANTDEPTEDAVDSVDKVSATTGLDGDTENEINKRIDSLKNNENVQEESEICEDCNTFESYVNTKGFGNMNECSEEDMAGLISSYVNDNDGEEVDYDSIAKYVSPKVQTELEEYGHGDFLSKLNPYMETLKEEDLFSYGAIEPTVTDIEEDDEFGIEGGDDTPEIETNDEMTGIEGDEEQNVSFAPNDTIGVVSPSQNKSKSVDIDLNSGKVNVTMTESEIKLRKYVRERLDVLSGKKKSSINESKKSETLKKLDEQIEKQYKLFESQMIDEGLFDSLKKKIVSRN